VETLAANAKAHRHCLSALLSSLSLVFRSFGDEFQCAYGYGFSAVGFTLVRMVKPIVSRHVRGSHHVRKTRSHFMSKRERVYL
jgi:hypothetical protein